MTPTVGRLVHYVSHGSPLQPDGSQAYTSQCRAAVVTEVPETQGSDGISIGLCILNPTGLFFTQWVREDQETHDGGTWHWPEIV